MTSGDCSTASGVYSSESNACVFYQHTTKTACESAANTWNDCGSLNIRQCIDCQWNDTNCPLLQSLLQCFVNRKVKCQTRQECEQQGGICSDEELLIKWPSNGAKPRWGGCIIPRNVTLDKPSICAYPLKAFRSMCLDESKTPAHWPEVNGGSRQSMPLDAQKQRVVG